MVPNNSVDSVEAQIKAWAPTLPEAQDLAARVQARILRDEYQNALLADSPFTLAGKNASGMTVWVRVQKVLTHRWVAVGYIAACLLVGIFVAHARATAYWQHHSDELAAHYVHLIDPATLIENGGVP